MRAFITIGLLVACLSSMGQSVLSNGSWYKIRIPTRGIYKLDRSFLEQNTNWDLGAIDPRTLKVYGNGPGMLPQPNAAPRAIDLTENAIYAFGLEDGSFDATDYLLFFAEGADLWQVVDGHFYYEDHLYSAHNYYFLTVGGEPGLRMAEVPTVDKEGTEITTYEDLFVHELNEVNILKNGQRRGGSGREWFGEIFQLNVDLEKEYSFPATGFTGQGELVLSTLSQSVGPSSMSVSINGDSIGTQALDDIVPIEVDPYDDRGLVSMDTFAINAAPADGIEIQLEFNRYTGGSSLARLDKILVMAERTLRWESGPLIFRSSQSMEQPVSQYLISETPEDAMVWNITDATSPSVVATAHGGGRLSFVEEASTLQEYVVLQGADFPYPDLVEPVPNQNLRALAPGDGLIITSVEFRSEAERLADFHRSHDGLDIAVVDVTHLYNEFSSGMPDVTGIRDAIRHYYQQSPNFRYVLLFGDCSYDYLDRTEGNTNYVPIYESRNSTHPIESYSSDDYYGFMEDEEGEWPETFRGSHTLEVGVGRLPVKSTKEATDIVNKIIRYSTSDRVVGSWKNKVTYVVDDGDRNIHVKDAESFSSIWAANQGQLQLDKLYLDAFEQEVGASSESSPILEEKVVDALNQGTFAMNYIGHGNEFLWMDEEILNVETIDGLTNRFKLPLIMTATCQFGRYDDPDFFSGSERLLLNPNGGAIALITTTRPVFASSNELVNEAFHYTLFEKIDGEFPRLGDIVRVTKNESRDRLENRNFALLGDPFLQLRYPGYQAVVDEINGRDITLAADTVSALEEIVIHGRILGPDNTTVTEFNGTIDILVLDSERSASTLGQESVPISFQTQNNPLFSGKATVTNGSFTARFIVTPNTSYRFDAGKITMYALDESLALEAAGVTKNLLLGGTAETNREDQTPPQMSLYVGDPSFRNGQVVESSSLLIAEVSDEFGINISGTAIHQNITLQLNEDEPIVVNEFFQYALDSYQLGYVIYPLENLDPGRYVATIKVWDLYNNSAEQTVEFIVSDLPSLTLTGVTNYPNPVKNETTFTFEHDRIGEEIQIIIDLYDMKGAMIEQLLYIIDDAPERIDDLTWDLNTSTIEKGVYLYRLTVRSTLDGAVAHQFRRLMRN